MVEVGVVAIDGTKMSANASQERNHGHERVAREVLAEAARIDAQEDELYGDARGNELPERLRTGSGRPTALTAAPGSGRALCPPTRWREQRGPAPRRRQASRRQYARRLGVGSEDGISTRSSHRPPTRSGRRARSVPIGLRRSRWRVSPQAAALVLGNGGAYVGDDNDGRMLRLTPSHGIQTLHGPKAATLSAAAPDALWAITRSGQLLRIGLAHR